MRKSVANKFESFVGRLYMVWDRTKPSTVLLPPRSQTCSSEYAFIGTRFVGRRVRRRTCSSGLVRRDSVHRELGSSELVRRNWFIGTGSSGLGSSGPGSSEDAYVGTGFVGVRVCRIVYVGKNRKNDHVWLRSA